MKRLLETYPSRKGAAPFYVVEGGVVLTQTEQSSIRSPRRWYPGEQLPGVTPGAQAALERHASFAASRGVYASEPTREAA
ncbi:MAG: hypothetical protein M3444_04380 [Acidobacteriota bacterium]|nr:hypothetical protein [Acidobacteriota bacterium]MDQ5835452.1 hypothetical protein [Acidobacteriota bacterium]